MLRNINGSAPMDSIKASVGYVTNYGKPEKVKQKDQKDLLAPKDGVSLSKEARRILQKVKKVSASKKSRKSRKKRTFRTFNDKPDSKTPKKPDPNEVILKFVCSKGDVEYHSAAESSSGVRAHEEGHIAEYHEIANRLGLMVVNPEILVFHTFREDLQMMVSTGGRAKCSFAAEINGKIVPVTVSNDGRITDPETAEKVKKAKMKR